MADTIRPHHSRTTSVLISGAGIAGCALAYRLERYGFRVTVVERAPDLRAGGQAVDVRGSWRRRRAPRIRPPLRSGRSRGRHTAGSAQRSGGMTPTDRPCGSRSRPSSLSWRRVITRSTMSRLG